MPGKTLMESMGSLTRRSFLRSSAAGGTLLFLVGNAGFASAFASKPKYSILVNVGNCIGCMKCVAGCEAYHKEFQGLSATGSVYTKVALVQSSADTAPMPQLCLHCVDAPCASACITHAITQLDYGPVVYDRSKCIGCLLCVNQCPFQSITFDPIEKKISKCDMCYMRIEKGMSPSCVEVCPTKTRSFGLYDDKLSEGMELAEKTNGVLLYAGETSTLYVLSRKQFETFLDSADVTVVKNRYPSASRWIADMLKYSRLAWVPVALGTVLYISKWRKGRLKEAS